MYLASLHVTLDLEPEVAQSDRERLLRALRDRVKQIHSARVTVRTDDDSSIVIALLDDNLERAKSRLEEIGDLLDNAGQARILVTTAQVFAWFEGRFQETADSRAQGDEDAGHPRFSDTLSGAAGPGRFGGPGRSPGFAAKGWSEKERPEKTIVYEDEDADDFEKPGLQVRSLAPTGGQGLGRRGMRIPTRK